MRIEPPEDFAKSFTLSLVRGDVLLRLQRKVGLIPAEGLGLADFVWTTEKLTEWIASPHNAVPETEMSFAGLSDANERAKVVAFLQHLSAK